MPVQIDTSGPDVTIHGLTLKPRPDGPVDLSIPPGLENVRRRVAEFEEQLQTATPEEREQITSEIARWRKVVNLKRHLAGLLSACVIDWNLFADETAKRRNAPLPVTLETLILLDEDCSSLSGRRWLNATRRAAMPTVAELAGVVSLDVQPFTQALDIARRAFHSFIDIGFTADVYVHSEPSEVTEALSGLILEDHDGSVNQCVRVVDEGAGKGGKDFPVSR
ncbi:MAG TPA: hypothetical protein VNO70_26330 [Blastocatellia bacterium]|nr:hypothetical protein [Blastocatellia bacterium]